MFLTACVAFFFFSGPVLHQLMQGVFLSAHTAFCFLLSRDQCFISKGYDATTHFETTVEDVLDMYKRITGGPSHTHTHGRMHAHHTQVYTRHTRARITAGTSHVQARHGWAVQIWATGGAVCAAPICLACMHLHGVGVRRTSLLSLSAKPASGEGGASVGAVGQRQRPCLL